MPPEDVVYVQPRSRVPHPAPPSRHLATMPLSVRDVHHLRLTHPKVKLRAAASEQKITVKHAALRAVLIHQAEHQSIEAVRPGASRDDYDQHKGIERLG